MAAFSTRRSFHAELEQQKARLGVAGDATKPRLLRRGTYTSETVAILSCNLGRDIKLSESPMPNILVDILSDSEWAGFVASTNARLKHYRAKKVDNAILALALGLPPLVALLIGRDKKRQRKAQAVLAATCAQFAVEFGDKRPRVELHFDHQQARADIGRSLSIRRAGAPVRKVPAAELDALERVLARASLGATAAMAAQGGDGSGGDAEGAAEVEAVLAALGLAQYASALVAEGFDTRARLEAATMDDLVAAGVKRGHARAIVGGAKGARVAAAAAPSPQQQPPPQQQSAPPPAAAAATGDLLGGGGDDGFGFDPRA